MSTDDPYSLDFFQTIVDVHFGNEIYLVVALSGGNNSFSFGPYPPAPDVSTPSLKSELNPSRSKGVVKLLDTATPSSGNNSTSGFTECFDWAGASSLSAEEAWILWHTTGLAAGEFPAVNNTCPWPGGGSPPDDTGIAPINFEDSVTAAKYFLFSVPEGTDLVSVSVGGIDVNFDSGLDTSNYSETSTSGAGNIGVRVFSRVKGSVTKLIQLVDINGDGKPRPTEDDACLLGITSDNQGKFQVDVQLDTDPTHAQTDNYGKTFQPYKVTLDPPSTSSDQIPAQPPPRLG